MKLNNISQLDNYDATFCEQQYTHGSCYISLFKLKSFDQFNPHELTKILDIYLVVALQQLVNVGNSTPGRPLATASASRPVRPNAFQANGNTTNHSSPRAELISRFPTLSRTSASGNNGRISNVVGQGNSRNQPAKRRKVSASQSKRVKEEKRNRFTRILSCLQATK